MSVAVDTSSLLALVRYYIPFDKGDSLKDFLNDKFKNGDLLILDKVFEEAKLVAQGAIINDLSFITDTKKHVRTVGILPDARFFKHLDNDFCDKQVMRLKNITAIGYEIEKKRYLELADCKLILHAYHNMPNNPLIVSEETPTRNDGKIFKKIPTNCNTLNIPCCTLPKLIKDKYNLKLSDFFH
ncbi:MAG: DUF4411 family protein [Ferruginibacter sp.]